MGLAPILVEQIFDIIRDINAQGITILRRGAERAHGAGRRTIAATSSRRDGCPERRRPPSCWRTPTSGAPTSADDPAVAGAGAVDVRMGPEAVTGLHRRTDGRADRPILSRWPRRRRAAGRRGVGPRRRDRSDRARRSHGRGWAPARRRRSDRDGREPASPAASGPSAPAARRPASIATPGLTSGGWYRSRRRRARANGLIECLRLDAWRLVTIAAVRAGGIAHLDRDTPIVRRRGPRRRWTSRRVSDGGSWRRLLWSGRPRSARRCARRRPCISIAGARGARRGRVSSAVTRGLRSPARVADRATMSSVTGASDGLVQRRSRLAAGLHRASTGRRPYSVGGHRPNPGSASVRRRRPALATAAA